nr:3-hydroxyacyl-CoA dehydrogenase NAD-binding domain-containing protein [Frankia sp. QA3]
MGAGIAYVAAQAGIEVVLKDVSLAAARRGRAHAEKLEAKALARGRTSPISPISPTSPSGCCSPSRSRPSTRWMRASSSRCPTRTWARCSVSASRPGRVGSSSTSTSTTGDRRDSWPGPASWPTATATASPRPTRWWPERPPGRRMRSGAARSRFDRRSIAGRRCGLR